MLLRKRKQNGTGDMAEMVFSQEIEVAAEAEDHTDGATESKLNSSKDKVGFSICSNKKNTKRLKVTFLSA